MRVNCNVCVVRGLIVTVEGDEQVCSLYGLSVFVL